MSNVLSLLDRLDQWKVFHTLYDEESVKSKQPFTVKIKLNQRNGNIGFDLEYNNQLVSFELTNVGIAQLEQVLEERKKL
jgi:hypothetical protein